MFETKKIGNKIAEARKKVNISQAQIAERLFISPQAVGKWERGESMPDIATFNRLAEILGVDFNYFSENFPSSTTEITLDESLIKHSAEMQSDKQKKKLNWDMSHGNWVDADFSGLKNLHEKFNASNMQRCKFNGSDLTGLLLKANNVDSCDFSNSDISNSHIQRSSVVNSIFKNCSLIEAEFSGSFIDGCDFSGTRFSGANFAESYIQGSDFTGADFTGVVIKSGGFTGVRVKSDFEKIIIAEAVWNRTSFIDTHIADIVFTGTLEDCCFENCAFTRVTFQNTRFINTFFKNNKKIKLVRFIECKADRMTYEFLKQGKADLTGITLLTPKEGNGR